MNENINKPFEKLAYSIIRNLRSRPKDPHVFSKRSERKAKKEIIKDKKSWLPGETINPADSLKKGYES